MKTLPLNDRVAIPILGFGTFELSGRQGEDAVKAALDVGYRHIDTADAYGNQRVLGKVLQESSVPRDELFLTSKVFHGDLKPHRVKAVARKCLAELQTSYLDLFLVHWPNRAVPIAETLGAFQELQSEGLIRAIGVSNFTVRHLKEAMATGVPITVNQVEFHPSLNQKALKAFCDEHNIVITAYSPLAQGQDLKLPLVKEIAEKYGKTPAQIVLAWLLAKGMVAIPRSANPEHIRENFGSLAVTLTSEDMTTLDGLNTNNRIINPSLAEFDY